MNIKIEGMIKVSTNDGDISEYPFEADNFKDAIAALIRKLGDKEIAEKLNMTEEEVIDWRLTMIGEYTK